MQGLTKSFYGTKLPESIQEIILDLCEFAKAKCPRGCGTILTPTLYEDFLVDGNFICRQTIPPRPLSHEDDEMTRYEIELRRLKFDSLQCTKCILGDYGINFGI